MPPSLDFNWQEGGEGSEQSIDDVQDPATFSPRSSTQSSRHSRKNAGPPPWGYLILLGVGVMLGLALGFVVLTAIGQYNARADFSSIVETEYRALAQGDRDLYTDLFDPEEQARQEARGDAFPIAAQLYDLGGDTPTVSNVHLLGDNAEVEIKFNYQGQSYRRLENLRRVDEQWRITRAVFPVWGESISTEEAHVTITYRERDAFFSKHIAQIEEITQFFCKRYQLPEPCQFDLAIQPDGDWPPTAPGDITESLSIVSPRLIGVSGDEPHPLWWSSLREAIAVIMARRNGVERIKSITSPVAN